MKQLGLLLKDELVNLKQKDAIDFIKRLEKHELRALRVVVSSQRHGVSNEEAARIITLCSKARRL